MIKMQYEFNKKFQFKSFQMKITAKNVLIYKVATPIVLKSNTAKIICSINVASLSVSFIPIGSSFCERME